MLVFWRADRTDWTAIDAGGGDGDEEAAVEPRIARLARTVADATIQHHVSELTSLGAAALVKNGRHQRNLVRIPIAHELPPEQNLLHAARDIAQEHERGQASSEDLRQAMVHYRALFHELLEVVPAARTEVHQPVEATRGRA